MSAEDGRVVRATRLAAVHDMRELIIDGTTGKSSGGGPSGTRDYELDARLYSSPQKYDYRVFGHLYSAEARFDPDTGRRQQLGVGLEYRSPRIVASGELAHVGTNVSTGGGSEGRAAATVSLAFTPGDHWTLGGEYETSAKDTPLQASLAGISARRASGEVLWRASESRAAALSYERMNFSDGNRRAAASAHWTERVVTGPVYKMELTGTVYASTNSLAGAPYFDPSRDFSPTLQMTNEWLQWRRYTRAFRHRLVLDIGSYQQQGFASGKVAGARYEQEWEADDRLTVRYGVGRGLHPYDGVATARNYAYLYLNWRF